MKKLYLITGATGHVGTMLTSELLRRREHIRALVLPGRGKNLRLPAADLRHDAADTVGLHGVERCRQRGEAVLGAHGGAADLVQQPAPVRVASGHLDRALSLIDRNVNLKILFTDLVDRLYMTI